MHQVDPSSKLIGSNLDFGSQGSKGFLYQKRGDLVRPPNLTRALGKGRMSSYNCDVQYKEKFSGEDIFANLAQTDILQVFIFAIIQR